MAADQWRKRLNTAGIVGFHGREQYRAKRKNAGLPQYDPNIKSHISLEWDGNQKRVVARRDQIGINQRDLRQFIGFPPSVNNVIADVFSVPEEIYTLENLNDVLSYEVWETYLSESERNHLMQFLPRGPEAEEVLEALLAGDNFHFGSPFLNWGASLCLGELHPDYILQQEQVLKTEKKAYYAELHKYHNNMIGHLLKLKERFESYKDPHKEIVQKIWRSRDDTDKRISSSVNDSRLCVPEDNVPASSESCSWVADEKGYSSDNQNSSMLKGGERRKRTREKVFIKDNVGHPSVVSDDVLNVGTKARKGDKRHMQNIASSDGAKYMSYFKISKKQHDIVKNMKGKSIQSKSLNRVLGNIDSINVQPYELFIKEEQKKLQEHWIQLANKALPVAYANWKELYSQRQQMRQSLEQELNERSKMMTEVQDDESNEVNKTVPQDLIEDGVEGHTLTPPDRIEDGVEDHTLTPQDRIEDGVEDHTLTPQDQIEDGVEDHTLTPQEPIEDGVEVHTLTPQDQIEDGVEDHTLTPQDRIEDGVEDHTLTLEDDKSVSYSPHRLPQQQLQSDDEFNSMDVDSKHTIPKPDHGTLKATEYSGNANTADVAISQGLHLSCSGDVWPAGNISQSYYDSTASHEYTSDDGLSVVHSKANEEQETHLIDLESNLQVGDAEKDMGPRQLEDTSFRQTDADSFGSYTNQDRNELFQTLFEGEGRLMYPQEQKQTRIDFQSSNNVLMEDSRFHGHFQEESHPSLPMEHGQKRESDVYLQQSVSESIYSDGSRFLIPRQEALVPADVPNWTVSSVRMPPPPIQSHLNREVQNWFSSEHQVRGGWTGSGGMSIPNQSIGSRNGGDQSLYSVLSQCNQLRASSSYQSAASTEQFISSRNYGMMGGGTTPGISNIPPQPTHSLDYINRHEAASSLMPIPDDMGWMGLAHQNPGLHDPMGKPYLRSWNQ